MVREATDALCAQIGEALEVRAPDNFLILYTHDSLSGSSKLRSFCERHELIASVPCYKDEGAGLAQIIRTTLRGYGLKASNEVIEYLASRLQGDRQVVLSELEKLSLYLGDDAEEVSMENALFLTADSREMSLDELCFAVAGGNIETVCRMVDTLTNEGVQPVVIVRSLMRYLQRLELAAQARYAGASLDVAIDQMRPPIFFKHKPLFRQHASRWSLGKIHDALHCLHRLEFTTKCESKMARVLLSQGLMDIAHMVTPQQRAA
jgi:DNA polymerase-3 subunit delta